MGREFCYRCLKSARLCVCDVTPVTNRTGVWIIQHPAERMHPVNSARLTALGLERASIDVAWHACIDAPEGLPADAAVLFPSHSSRDLGELPDTERPSGLILIDGTWAQARKLYRKNEWLHDLPHVHLNPEAPSRYRIRKQPREGYLSTLEATVLALRILEPETAALDRLLERFDAMVAEQARFIENPPPGAYRHARSEGAHPAPRVPDSIAAGDSLVVAYGDFLADRSTGRTQPVVVALARPATGEQRTFLFRGADTHPALEHLGHMGVHPNEYAAAEPVETAPAQIRSFLRPGETLCVWNPATGRALQKVTQTVASAVSLKADYCNWCRGRSGHLEEVVRALRRQDARVSVPTLRLRAERRLAQILAVREWLERDVRAVLAKHSTRKRETERTLSG